MKQIAVATAVALALAAGPLLAEGMTHKVAVHVDEADPQLLNMALNNVQNLAAYYAEQGDEVIVEVVTYGPGLHMLIDGKSPVSDRVSAMALELDNVTFAACANTIAGMEKRSGEKVTLMSEATVVPSGVVRLVELQEQGYAYVRP